MDRHQDDHIAYTHLDRWGQLNVDMDQLAKAHWQALANNRPASFFLPPTNGQWCIWHSLCRLSRWHPDKSSTIYHNQALMTYWYKRLKINQSTHNIHCWNALARGYRRVTIHQLCELPRYKGGRLVSSPRGELSLIICPCPLSICPMIDGDML